MGGHSLLKTGDRGGTQPLKTHLFLFVGLGISFNVALQCCHLIISRLKRYVSLLNSNIPLRGFV